MKTIRIDGIAPMPNDEQILRGLLLQAGRPRGDGPACRIGIAGPDGNVYRCVIAHGIGELAAVERLLNGFGFVECAAEDEYRAVFHDSVAAALTLGPQPACSRFEPKSPVAESQGRDRKTGARQPQGAI